MAHGGQLHGIWLPRLDSPRGSRVSDQDAGPTLGLGGCDAVPQGEGPVQVPVRAGLHGSSGPRLLCDGRVAAQTAASQEESPVSGLREICCDTCPLSPTCEEENDFLRDLFGWDELATAEEHGWGEVEW